jgi:hypothetical protein
MKLIAIVKTLLFELAGNKQKILRYRTEINDIPIRLFSSHHQWFDRQGDLTYDELKSIYYEKIYKQPKFRIGVPDSIITDIFKKKLNKIIAGFGNLKETKIIFVTPNSNNEDDETFDYIEFLLSTNDVKLFTIVTSAFSSDGNYLRNINKTERLRLEHKINHNIKIIYI